MNNTHDYPQDAPVLREASRNRCLIAFLVTSLAAFLLIGLTWPLSMHGYQSEGMIEFENQQVASSLIKDALPSVLRSVMNPTAIMSRVDNIQSNSGRKCSLFDAANPEEILGRISIGFRDQSQARKPRLRIVLSGKGTADEARFIQSFASDVAMRLEHAANATLAVDSTNATDNPPIQQAEWLVDQIEEGLTSARTQTAQLMTYQHTPDQGTTFRKVGHISEPSTPNMDSLHQTLESVDVASLRGVIEQFKESESQGNTGLVRFNADSVNNHPVGAVPDAASLMLAGLFSVVLGGVVAWNIHPFTDPGFETVDDVSRQLGVPVIGTLKGEQLSTEVDEKPLWNNWANRAVRINGTILAAIAILGIGFWLTSAEVRNSFGESWFHGFARIVWKLSGS